MSERLIEFVANTVKRQRFDVINDIPDKNLKEYETISKRESQMANDVYQFNHGGPLHEKK